MLDPRVPVWVSLPAAGESLKRTFLGVLFGALLGPSREGPKTAPLIKDIFFILNAKRRCTKPGIRRLFSEKPGFWDPKKGSK